MRVYISGPMTGYADYNFPAFNHAADILRDAGYDVENPADKGKIDGWEWVDYMKYDIEALIKCDAIFMMKGWEYSKGASLEHHIACELGLEFIQRWDVA